MAEHRLFEEGTVPEWTTPEWYAGREAAPHLEQELHRPRLQLAAEFALHAYSVGARSLVDLGSGDGGFLTLVQPPFENAYGVDLQQSNVDAAVVRGVHVELGDVVNGGDEWWADVAIATEMLEHLVDPHAFVRKVATTCEWLVASSPWNESPGAAYSFHTWAWDQDGYRALVEQAGYEVQRHGTTGMFQVLLARRV